MSNYQTKIFKNEDGFFRVKIFGYMDSSGQGRWLMDSDLMIMMSSSHRSKEMTFGSIAAANEAIATFHRIRNNISLGQISRPPEKDYSDTWKDISDPQPKLTSKTDEAGNYKFHNIDELFQWAIRKIKK